MTEQQLVRHRLADARYRAKHPEREKARILAWRNKNRQRVSEVQALYDKRNRGKKRVYLREYRRKRPAQTARYCREYYWRNVQKVAAKSKKYNQRHRFENACYQRERYRKNPSLRIGYSNHRRARCRNAGGSFSPEEWIALCRKFNWKCAHCGKRKKLTQDHIVPLSRGGTNSISNIQPLCKPCNSSKGVQF